MEGHSRGDLEWGEGCRVERMGEGRVRGRAWRDLEGCKSEREGGQESEGKVGWGNYGVWVGRACRGL